MPHARLLRGFQAGLGGRKSFEFAMLLLVGVGSVATVIGGSVLSGASDAEEAPALCVRSPAPRPAAAGSKTSKEKRWPRIS
jgi:hypothetical protein